VDTIGYRTAEYGRSSGPRFHGAPSAWVRGYTGAGTIIGIVDSGIEQANPEFTGRISPHSIDVAGNGTVEAEGEHGTVVAMIAAADNDNASAGTVGIAYDATILAIRADSAGSCASADDCSFADSDIAQGIDHAVEHGARVVNISLGGGSASIAVSNAVGRAAAAGVVVVVAAGNDGNASPEGFATSLVGSGAGHGNVIIVGSVDESGTISSFSNKAGNSGAVYLAALGERVRIHLDGRDWLYSGTSFSAPQVSGAVALLAQAFPSLTAADIVEILLESAQDVGVAGVDKVYGHGILDIDAAFQPSGTTTLAGTGSPIPLGDTSAAGSPAMGDALSIASLSAVVLDKYSRAYRTDLGLAMRSASISRRLLGAVGGRERFVSARAGGSALAFTIDNSGQGAGLDAASQLRLSPEDAEAARVLAARIALRISPKTQIGLAYAEGSDGLVAQLQGHERPVFLVAPTAVGDEGAFRRTDVSFALRRMLGRWGLTLSGESGEIVSGAPVELADRARAYRRREGVQGAGLALDRSFGPLDAALGISWVSEDRTVLGARFHDAFGGGGAESMFVDASAGWDIGGGWRVAGALRDGWTFADSSGVIGGGSRIHSRAWSLDLERRGVFRANDALGIRIAQPLRVESGGLNLRLPVAYSYATGATTFGIRPLSLAPEGREIMGEIAWRGPLWAGQASASLFYRREPGHFAHMPDDAGAALRWSKSF